MAIWRVDVRLYASAYIRAKTAEEAMLIARAMKDSGPGIDGSSGEIEICGLRYEDPDLPDVSLSPEMTIYGPDDGEIVELAHEENTEDEHVAGDEEDDENFELEDDLDPDDLYGNKFMGTGPYQE